MVFQLALGSWGEEEVLKRRLNQVRLSGCSGEPWDVYRYTPGKGGQNLGDALILFLQPVSSSIISLFFPPCPLSVSSSFLPLSLIPALCLSGANTSPLC